MVNPRSGGEAPAPPSIYSFRLSKRGNACTKLVWCIEVRVKGFISQPCMRMHCGPFAVI